MFFQQTGPANGCPYSDPVFYCNSTRQCIPQYFVCDGDRDCDDGSDESNCGSRACPDGYFRCTNGQCIPSTWVCDGHADCSDSVDERQNCQPPKCDETTHFACKTYIFNSTHCIPKHWKCDKHRDCADGSDEDAAICTYRQCQAGDFHCGITYNARGIAGVWNSTQRPAIDDEVCIPPSKRCNGYRDCRDGSDEVACPTSPLSSISGSSSANATACELDEFRCADGERCIPQQKRCDHRNDCLDNSDEQDCSFRPCSGDEFTCANFECIPRAQRCDGLRQCLDGSDEFECSSSCTGPNEWKCPLSASPPVCIDKAQVCDGIENCPRGEDERQEENFCSSSLCPALSCESGCAPSPTGGRCTCPAGYKIDTSNATAGNRSCVDLNECETWGYCDQGCVNMIGSYRCYCAQGYQFDTTTTIVPSSAADASPSSKSASMQYCKADDPFAFRLILARRASLLQIDNKDGTSLTRLVNTTKAYGVDFHLQSDTIFWTDVEPETEEPRIYSATLSCK